MESGLAAKVSVNLDDDDRRRSDEMMGYGLGRFFSWAVVVRLVVGIGAGERGVSRSPGPLPLLVDLEETGSSLTVCDKRLKTGSEWCGVQVTFLV